MEWEPAVSGSQGGRRVAAPGTIRLLLVQCGRYRLGFPSGLVRGVVAPGEIVPVGLPELEGLMWREGALIPAAKLGPRLGLRSGESSVCGHGVLVRSGEGLLCLLVDEALDLVEVPATSVVALPPLVRKVVPLEGLESAALVESLLLIVDPVRLLGQQGVAELMAAAARVGNPGATREEPE